MLRRNGDFDIGMAVEERRFPKMQNWRHYFMKTRVKRKKNWLRIIRSDSTSQNA